MPNILEYTLLLKDRVSGTMTKIGIANDRQLETWAKVQRQVTSADATMKKCGISIGSLRERVAALRAEREWIPANNINAIRRSNIEIKSLERQIGRLEAVNGGRLKAWFGNLKSAVPMVGMLTNPLLWLGAAVYKVGNYIRGSQDAWNIQMQGEVRLATVMRQRVKASDAEIDSIKRLASAQQAIGVIGDEVQLSGAQQLATFISRKDSLDSLIPAMNNLLAQQRGLNATDQDAVNIGNLMGKVLQGQTSALTRVGITFTAAEEKMLKYGNEQQRAAMLAQVINNNVGQMNQALAATPEGKLKQHANTMGDLQERVGSLYSQVKASLLPLFDTIGSSLEGVISWIERNRDSVLAAVNVVAQAIHGAFSLIGSVIGGAIDMFNWWTGKLREGSVPVTVLTTLLGSLAGAMVLMTLRAKAMAVWAGIVQVATWAWAAASNALNLSLWLNPITWIIAAIIALIGVIAYVAYTTEGWGDTWSNTWKWIKLTFAQAGEWLHLKWLQVQNFFMTGFEVIEQGWYKLKKLWDKDGAEQGLARIQADRDARAAEIAKAKGKIDELAAQRRQIDMWQVKSNGKSLADITSGLKRKMGIETPSVPGMAATPGGDTGDYGGGNGGTGVGAASSIATGGSKSTSITINLKSLVENIVFEGGYEQGRDSMQKDLESALIRVLEMAYAAQ
ncbi:hypothetical protein [Alistipes sp.]|uniref:hypothetical protein n=1 Tax=Alistipes sp. TaxID=1872444 RepID=UPI003AB36088